jgi:hypothetical protein
VLAEAVNTALLVIVELIAPLKLALVPLKAPVSVPPDKGRYDPKEEVRASVPVADGRVYVNVPFVIVEPKVRAPVNLPVPVTSRASPLLGAATTTFPLELAEM